MNDFATDYRVPKRVTLHIAVFYTASCFAKDDRGTIAKAREILDRHNIELSVWPDNGGQKGGGNMFPDITEKIPHKPEAYKALRARVAERMRGSGLVVYAPAVFTQYEYTGFGIAPPSFKSFTYGCLLHPNGNDDGCDLLHELGHCAMTCSDSDHEKERSNVMNVANGRSTLYRKQVEKFAKANFAVG
jgi:hypothetical protein